jgi:hypothetical protein
MDMEPISGVVISLALGDVKDIAAFNLRLADIVSLRGRA